MSRTGRLYGALSSHFLDKKQVNLLFILNFAPYQKANTSVRVMLEILGHFQFDVKRKMSFYKSNERREHKD